MSLPVYFGNLPFRRYAMLAAVILFSVSLPGCTGKPADDVIRFALATAPSNLDPRYATDATSERLNKLLYSRLVGFDDNYFPVPELASWKKINDKKYVFELLPKRPRFSNGKRLTAHDVVASYEYILDPENLSPHRESISIIKQVWAIDDEHIAFELSTPDPLFPAYLHIAILPAELIDAEHDFNGQPIGSGTFALSQKTSAKSLLLTRKRDQQKIRFVEVKDPTVRVLKLLNDEVDLLQNDLSPEMTDYLAKQGKVDYQKKPGTNFTYLGFNLADKLTGNPQIRKAISHAINRDEIIQYAFKGTAVTAEALLPPQHWAGHPELQKIVFNPSLSRNILEQLGYNGDNPLNLSYKTSSDPFRIRLATIIQSQLAEVGIKLTIQSYDWGTFFGDIKSGNFQIYSLSWVGINTPDIFRYVFHSKSIPPDGANRGRYQSKMVDQLLEQAAMTTTLDKQAVIFHRIQEFLHNDLPYMPLWYEHQQAFVSQKLTGYQLSSDGNYESLDKVRYR